MKYLYLLALVLITSCGSSQNTVTEKPAESAIKDIPANPVMYAETITEDDLKEHLYVYASDDFEGRETGEPGQKKAVEYLRSYYQGIQVAAAQENGDYFQKVPLEISKLPGGSVNIGENEYKIGDDFVSFTGLEGSFDEIIYVGHGIDTESYSDYSGLDVEGKLVLMKSGEPKDGDGTYLVSGTNKKSVWSNNSESLEWRIKAAKQNGAKAILYFDPNNYSRFRGYYNIMSSNEKGRMRLKSEHNNPVLVLLNKETATGIYAAIEDRYESEELKLPVQFNLRNSNSDIVSENVVAVIPGFEKPDEYVVISSHLDHIGVSANGKINNGADDDGSGTVAMLEIAEAFKKAVRFCKISVGLFLGGSRIDDYSASIANLF